MSKRCQRLDSTVTVMTDTASKRRKTLTRLAKPTDASTRFRSALWPLLLHLYLLKDDFASDQADRLFASKKQSSQPKQTLVEGFSDLSPARRFDLYVFAQS
jgi:hypothetical protein